MEIDVKTLFKVVGEEGPALRRVEEAMEWLLSPKAEGIGQKLLQDAHAVHNKPLTIVATTLEQNGYYAQEGHIVKINPDHLAKVHLRATDGAIRPMSVERALAHELTHSGQKEATAEIDKALDAMKEKAQQAVMDGLDPQKLAAQQAHLNEAIENGWAWDDQTRRQHAADYVDQFLLPQNDEVMRHLQANPEFQKYVARMEVPAVAVENRVARLRGEPERIYNVGHEITPEALREITINEILGQLKPCQVPPPEYVTQQRADGNKWADSLGTRSGRRLGG